MGDKKKEKFLKNLKKKPVLALVNTSFIVASAIK